MNYVDFNDNKIPIGKRKQAYIKFAIKNGTDLRQAKIQANKKFGFEQSPGIFAVVEDLSGRSEQRSFTGSLEIFEGHDLRKYKNHAWKILEDEEEMKKVVEHYKLKGFKIIHVDIHS